jgi:hypothetical protein
MQVVDVVQILVKYLGYAELRNFDDASESVNVEL